MNEIETKLAQLSKRECPQCKKLFIPETGYPFKLCPKCMTKKGKKGVAIHDYE